MTMQAPPGAAGSPGGGTPLDQWLRNFLASIRNGTMPLDQNAASQYLYMQGNQTPTPQDIQNAISELRTLASGQNTGGGLGQPSGGIIPPAPGPTGGGTTDPFGNDPSGRTVPGAGTQPNPRPIPTYSGNPADAGARQAAFDEQDPATAFTRYMENLPGGGGAFGSRLRGAMQSRGAQLGGLAHLFGYGAARDTPGGAGRASGLDVAPWYQQQNSALPSWNDIQSRLNEAYGATQAVGPQGAGNPSIYQIGLNERFEGENAQMNALMAAINSRFSSGGRMGAQGNAMQDIWNREQASNPSGQSFFDFARSRGWF